MEISVGSAFKEHGTAELFEQFRRTVVVDGPAIKAKTSAIGIPFIDAWFGPCCGGQIQVAKRGALPKL